MTVRQHFIRRLLRESDGSAHDTPDAGYSVVETLTAFALVSVVCLPLIHAFTATRSIPTERMRALSLARSITEFCPVQSGVVHPSSGPASETHGLATGAPLVATDLSRSDPDTVGFNHRFSIEIDFDTTTSWMTVNVHDLRRDARSFPPLAQLTRYCRE